MYYKNQLNNSNLNFQFGFRSKHATTHQLHRFVYSIPSAPETNKYCARVFIHVAEAFNSVCDDGLLYELKKILPGLFYLELKTYLETYSNNVRHNIQHPNYYSTFAGVFRDSCVVLIHSSDLPRSENIIIGTYAGDTTLLPTLADHTISYLQLQNYLNILPQWFTN